MKRAGGHIAFIIHSLKLGGSEKFFLNLVNNLYRRGHRPLVILLENENPLLGALDAGVKRVIVPRKFKYDLSVSFRIKKVLEAHHIQTVFCVEPYAFFLAKLANLFNNKVRYYLSLHNSLPIGFRKYFLEMSYLRLVQKTDRVIFICNYQRDYFSRIYLFRPGDSYVIHNGVDVDHFSPSAVQQELSAVQHSWRNDLGIQEHEKVILMIGRISPEKGHVFAIRALHFLHRQHGLQPHLVIVGTGSETLLSQLKELVHQLQLNAYVHFTGGQLEVRQYLLHSDIFVMTSVSETFSLAALEALSIGTPVSLTRIGGAAEMICSEDMGSLCTAKHIESIAGSWHQLLTGKYDRSAIRAKTMQMFSDKKMIDRYEEVLKSL
jgi:glycosyltransferase involved in cell wall biosynthesis